MLDKLLHAQVKYSKILLVILILIITSASFIAKDLKIDPDFSILVSPDSEFNTNDKILKKAFVENAVMIIFIKKDPTSILTNVPNDMNDPKVQNYIDEIKSTLSHSQFVVGFTNPMYSPLNQSLQMMVKLSMPQEVGSIQIVKHELDALLTEAGSPPGIQTTISGFPVLLDRVSTLLIRDNLNTILITLIFIFIILYLYSRDIYFSLITITTPIVSLIFLAAFLVLLNIDLTITLAAVGVLILGLGADYSIHISTHYTKAKEKFKDHETALFETIKRLLLPITASFITTLAGFSALIFGVSPSSQAQGVVLSIGISVIYATTFILFPITMTVFSKKVNIKPNYVLERILAGLANFARFQVKHPKMIISTILLLTVVMIYGASTVTFSTSNSNWIPDNDDVSIAQREIESTFGISSANIDIVLQSTKGDLRNVQTARDINKIISVIESIPNVDVVHSPYKDIEYDTNILSDKITNIKSLRDQFNTDFTLTRISIMTSNMESDSDGKSILLAQIRDVVDRYPVHNSKTSLYGNSVRFDELTDSLQKDAGITTMIGLILVFLVASLTYASFFIGVLALIPIILAIIWAVGFMGYFDIPFTSLSTGIISLVLGIGVDFSIHWVDSIKQYLKKLNINNAIYETMVTSGKAIFISSLTTFFGFLALTFAKLLGTQRLGWSLAFSILSVFIISITLVPTVMTLIERSKFGGQIKWKQ